MSKQSKTIEGLLDMEILFSYSDTENTIIMYDNNKKQIDLSNAFYDFLEKKVKLTIEIVD